MTKNLSEIGSFTPVDLPAGFREPTDGSLRYRPDGAMPANPYIDDVVRQRQVEIDTEYRKLYDYPPEGTPEGFATMLLDDYMIHEERRKMLNFEGYQAWQAKGGEIPEDLEESVEHFMRGTAYEDEIIDIALNTDIEEFEVGKVSHPYRRRLEFVDQLRRGVDAAIVDHGGEAFGKYFPYRSIDITPHVTYVDGELQVNGFIIPYKRDVGDIPLPDGSGMIRIVERQLAAFRADATSGFPQDIIQRMKETPIDWSASYQDDDYREALVNTGCHGFIVREILFDSLKPFVVPVSTTIYGYKQYFRPEPKETPAGQALRLTTSLPRRSK